MAPGSVGEDEVDAAFAYPVYVSEIGSPDAERVQGADVDHIGFGQLVTSIPGASAIVASAFGFPVDGVVFLGAEKQVAGANACWIVAMVENAEVGGDWAVDQHPGYPGGCMINAVDPEMAVPCAASVSCPFPTGFSKPDFREEPNFGRDMLSHRFHLLNPWSGTARVRRTPCRPAYNIEN